MFGSVGLYTDPTYTSAFFVAEVICLLPLNAFGAVIGGIELAKVLMAKKDPKKLLSPEFDSYLTCPLAFFGLLQVLSLINLYFVADWAVIFAEEKEYPGGDRTVRETILLVIYILLVTMTSFILLFILFMIGKGCMSARPVKEQKDALKQKLLLVKPVQYSEIEAGSQKFCALCFTEFAPSHGVVKAGCTDGHIFHYQCMV